jgi:hypothetical protein
MNSSYKTLALATLALSTIYTPALAQDTAIPQLGQDKAQMMYAPEAAWVLSAGGTAGLAYTDNVFRSPVAEKSDSIATLKPDLEIKGNLGDTQVRLGAEAEKGFYSSYSDNDYFDAGVRGSVASQINPASKATAGLYYKKDHISIGAQEDDPDRLLGEPTTYRNMGLDVGSEHQLDDVSANLNFGGIALDYDNVSRVNGTTVINDDRDRAEYELGGRIGYAVTPKVKPYIQTTLNSRAYDERVDGTAAFSRDSVGAETLVGAEFKPSEELLLDVAIGYLGQDYEAAVLEDVNTIASKAVATWQITPLQSITAGLTRHVRETTVISSSSYIQTQAKLGTEVEFAPRWMASGFVRYTLNEFQNSIATPEREDDTYDLQLQVEHLLTDSYLVGGRYTFTSRSSDNALVEYDRNLFMLYVTAQY